MEENMRFIFRKSTRLKNYDYSGQNYYFITVCTYEKRCIFGSTEKLSDMGEIARKDLLDLASHYKAVRIDNCIVMPNHIHAIIVIEGCDGITGKTKLDSIVGSYKSGVSRKIRKKYPNTRVWQRSFHDHIIRGQKDYEKIWTYIQYNDQKWEADCFYPIQMRN